MSGLFIYMPDIKVPSVGSTKSEQQGPESRNKQDIRSKSTTEGIS